MNTNTNRIQEICRQDVPVVEIDGRWFITLGHPGFNSKANNGKGYATKQKALKAIVNYSIKTK
ncbi:MAG: hypothetical protein ACO3QQ_03045 [Candidatus Nanopelagicaceae bacterium]